LDEMIREYSKRSQTAASLQMLMKTGRGEMLGKSYKEEAYRGKMGQRLATQRILVHVASLLRKELPIRLAHRIQDLDRVPLMSDMPSVKAVKQVYVRSFRELVETPPIHTAGDEEAFAEMLAALYGKHANVLVQMARGAYELREQIRTKKIPGRVSDKIEGDFEFARMRQLHHFLDRFYLSRVGIRVLAGQYLALRQEPMEDYIGMICLKTSPRRVVKQAADDARKMCRRRYGRAPLVEISGSTDLTFPYIPTYLHYISLELLKNALRATCEHHGDGPLPPVQVIIADSVDNEDVVIKIADEGGGIRRSQLPKIWSYLYTTASPKVQQAFIADQDHGDASPIAGLGYGLPISRAYCRYFGGDMDLVSMEGFGTDAFLHLKRLGDSEEPLPV